MLGIVPPPGMLLGYHPGYVHPVYTLLPGTPHHQPTLLRCTGNPAEDGQTALRHEVVERTVSDGLLTVLLTRVLTVTRFTVGRCCSHPRVIPYESQHS